MQCIICVATTYRFLNSNPEDGGVQDDSRSVAQSRLADIPKLAQPEDGLAGDSASQGPVMHSLPKGPGFRNSP